MEDNLENKNVYSFKITTILNIFFLFCILGILGYYLLGAPVNKFNTKEVTIHISTNETLDSIIEKIDKINLVRSKFFLKSFIYLFKLDKKIEKGDYLFKRNSPVFSIAWQLARGKHNVNQIKITLREGLTNEEMANIFVDKLSSFRRDIFFEKSYNKQGYLFPDTYFFFPMDTTEEVFYQLSQNFDNQIKKVDPLIKKSKYSKENIIIMASIIEKEAKGEKDAFLISGILWKRLEIGMSLQVDASPITYKEKGLPNSPICNPGLLSIKASLEPIDSSYLYYLHDNKGEVHFAKNYEEHQKNIKEFLK